MFSCNSAPSLVPLSLGGRSLFAVPVTSILTTLLALFGHPSRVLMSLSSLVLICRSSGHRVVIRSLCQSRTLSLVLSSAISEGLGATVAVHVILDRTPRKLKTLAGVLLFPDNIRIFVLHPVVVTTQASGLYPHIPPVPAPLPAPLPPAPLPAFLANSLRGTSIPPWNGTSVVIRWRSCSAFRTI
jgi:hypothetical protein